MTGKENSSVRYEFGKNWSEFASRLPQRAIEEAVAGMARLYSARYWVWLGAAQPGGAEARRRARSRH